MPLVILTVSPDLLSTKRQAISDLAQALPGIFASTFSCNDPNATLTPAEVEVRVQETGPLGVNTAPLAIDAFIPRSPSRKRNLKGWRTKALHWVERIAQSVNLPLSDAGGVWVILVDSNYGSFTRSETL